MLNYRKAEQRMQRFASFFQRQPKWQLIFLLLLIVAATLQNANCASIYNEDGKAGVALKRVVSDTSKVANLTRRHNGDVFYSYDVHECDTDSCVGLSSGTANLLVESNVKEIDMSSENRDGGECKCQCLPHISTYREDLGICVDDIRECSMASFTSSSSAEKIPFIFLPLKGQIIYPSKEISYPGLKEAVCEVQGAQYLTKNGWNELRNPVDSTTPFKLFRDDDSTFLQWLGEPDLRYRMNGRLILIHLICREMASFEITGPDDRDVHEDGDLAISASDHHGTFTPCVAFRVYGTPSKYTSNVSEVLFASESQIDHSMFKLTTKEYILIATASLCLGLIYIASVFLYLHIKKRKSQNRDSTGKDEYTYQQNDQVTFGAGISRSVFGGQSRSSILSRSLNGSQRGPGTATGPGLNMHTEEIGIIKSNPLLKHYPNLQMASDNSGFVSDTSNSNSEFDDDFSITQDSSNNKTLATIHSRINDPNNSKTSSDSQLNASQEQECLPEEDVSITEEMNQDEQLDTMKAIMNVNARRKLYFNPAYFEPHLLVSPPPAAIEFLTKIREVITIAKHKMAVKRFQPSLIVIPEEKAASETYVTSRKPPSRRESLVSSSRNETPHKSACSGCSDCQSRGSADNAQNSTCKNCGDKQKHIQKWLEGVSTSHESLVDEEPQEIIYGSQKDIYNSGSVISSISSSNHNCKTNDINNKTNDIIKPDLKRPQKPPKPNGSTNNTSSRKSESSNSETDTIKAPSVKTGRTIRTPSEGLPAESIYSKDGQNGTSDSTKTPDYLPLHGSFEPNSRPGSTRGSIKKVPELIAAHDIYSSHASSKGSKRSNGSVYDIYGGGSEIYNNPQFDDLPLEEVKVEKPKVPPPLPTTKPPIASTKPVLNRPRNLPPPPPVPKSNPVLTSTNSVNSKTSESNKTEAQKLSKVQSSPANYYEQPFGVEKQLTRREAPTYSSTQKKIANPAAKTPHIHHHRPNPVVQKPKNNPMTQPPVREPCDPFLQPRGMEHYHRGRELYMKTNSRQTRQQLYEKNPNRINARGHIPYEIINKMNQMPDMVYEAIASDYSRAQMLNGSAPSPQLPTPDYQDSDSNCGTFRKIHHRLQKSMHNNDEHPQVPTPDYNTLGRRTPKKLYQPDSPIYSRKSPFNLVVDYETDSLERNSADKSRKSATPPSQISEGSQISPSLSSALPLEEEVEIRNAIYDRVQGYRDEVDASKKQQKQLELSKEPKIKYNTPFMGSMTIEVEHSPDEFDLSTDSDQFEPDTLDRKAKKKGFINGKPTKYFEDTGISEKYAENHSQSMCSLPDMSDLKSAVVSGFAKPSTLVPVSSQNNIAFRIPDEPPPPKKLEKPQLHRSFESLREMYESKTSKSMPYIPILKEVVIDTKEEGRLLTLEHRHSKRQRQVMETLDKKLIKPPVEKKLAPPDLIPSTPVHKSKVQHFVKAAPKTGKETTWKKAARSDFKYQKQVNSADETYESMSQASDSTAFTGVSDKSSPLKTLKNGVVNGGYVGDKDDVLKKNTANKKMGLNILESYLTLGEITNKDFLNHVNGKLYDLRNECNSKEKQRESEKEKEDLDKIEVVSTKTLSNYNGSLTKEETNSNKSRKMGYKDFDQAINNLPKTTKIFRVEVPPMTSGMQIAMGVKDRAKKSKEIKNAWRRFIDLASSKFSGKSETKIDEPEVVDKDDGIGSLLEEQAIIPKKTSSLEKPKQISSVSVSRSNSSRLGSRDSDGGYMSADSNESRIHNKRLYERFNFNKNNVKCINEEVSKLDLDEGSIERHRAKLQTKDISGPIVHSTSANSSKERKKKCCSNKQNVLFLSPPPSRPPPTPPGGAVKTINSVPKKLAGEKPTEFSINNKELMTQLNEVLNVNAYASDEGDQQEAYSNAGEVSSESDGDFNFDDLCESGAESVETHSVFFKNIKSNQQNSKNS